ncbi:phage major capsid protein [Nocardioides bigeumensis]|uniref:Phage capsid-like C-terminal domain-containing protein n=1 Tax=Nocardioides bigeumensis TaxID=433657 RepID=A0ABN2XMS5_9ACTN
MSTSTALHEKRIVNIKSARDIVERAQAAGRELTSSETDQVTACLSSVKTIDKQIAGKALVDSVVGLTNVEDTHGPTASGSLFSDTDKAGIIHAAKSRTAYRADLNVKAAITTGALLPTSGTYVEGGLHPTQFPIATLFQQQAADGPSVRYYRTTAGTAAVVAEGALKPDAGISFAAVDVLLSKLAARAEFSTEMAEDAPYLLAFLQSELMAALIAAENALILTTFAATSGVLTATGAGTTIVDMIADAISAQESVSGSTPSAILAAPSVVATIRKSKATTSGVYNVDILSTAPTMLHGVRIVSSPAVPSDNVWVVVGSGVTLYRRGGAHLEIGTSADNFATNTRTVIGEERLAVAVTRPTALSKLVLT